MRNENKMNHRKQHAERSRPIPGGSHRRGSGRRRRGDVRLSLLLLLKLEGPANGYQLMQKLEEKSEGNWRPSPGSIYPTLAQLEDEGLVAVVSQSETIKVFQLTQAGVLHVDKLDVVETPWANSLSQNGKRGELRRAMGKTMGATRALVQEGSDEKITQAIEIFRSASRELYLLLAEEAKS